MDDIVDDASGVGFEAVFSKYSRNALSRVVLAAEIRLGLGLGLSLGLGLGLSLGFGLGLGWRGGQSA